MDNLLIDGIITFVSTTIQIYIQSIILNISFNLKLSTKDKTIYAFGLAIYTTIFRLFAVESLYLFNPISYILLGTIILFILKKSSFLKGILYNTFLIVLAIPVEIISGILAFQILKLPSSNENVIGSIPILVVIILCYLLIACVLSLLKEHKNINLQFNNRFIGINIAFVALLLIPNVMFYVTNRYNYPASLLIYNIFANIILVILSIYNTYKYIKLEHTEMELKNSEMYNKSLTELVDSIRIFKHDYNNVVHAIGGYIATNDINGLKKYYTGLVKESKRVNQLESITPDKINEPSIYGLFASKYQIAESKYIEFNFESMINYQELNMPVYDFGKILGVLLDNAIEAAEECDEKKINVSFRKNKKTGIQLLTIENTYKDKNIDIEKLFEKNYSTKNRNSGIGLWEVKNIVSKNKNVSLNTTKNDTFFKQELYINSKNI